MLTRAKQSMPEYVRKALKAKKLERAYRARPPYQRNDYLGWIKRAKRPETQQKRLNQMLQELDAGDSYMGMDYNVEK